MGRGMKRNRFAQKRRERKEQGTKDPNVKPERAPYQEIVKENEKFVRYYQHAGICPETEWNDLLETIRSDLPATFRLSGSKNTAKRLLEIIRNEFFTKYVSESIVENVKKAPICLPWYPNQMAYQLELSRKDIRRSESHYKLHNFLIAETDAGSISRQEAVSMIPPLVLDVKPHHKVLDMCAAPGSKTAQLIEALHADEAIPSGFVVANDVDNNRCYMLVHQAKRLNSPCFVVVNQDSSCMPAFRTPEGSILKFDRILCDVPCTGDGTMRKNPDIWKKWHLGNALNLHGTQYRIARRGAEMLDIGGRLVYSTCSLNPVENESVLHRLLKDAEGALELVDGSELVPGLKYAPGISYWELSDKNCEKFYKTFDEVPKELHTQIRPQMFPPSADEVAKYSLDKCMRILPHFQNTGGFFVAALTKKGPLPWERKPKESKMEQDVAASDEHQPDAPAGEVEEKRVPWGPQRKKRRIYGYKEDPFVFFTEEEPVWQGIQSFFDIDNDKLDAFKPTQLLTRSLVGKKKNIYFCSQAVKELVQANEENVKIINTGVRVFARCDHRHMRCEFRLANEGLEAIYDVIGDRRRIDVTKNDMISLLEHNDAQNPPPLEMLSQQVNERMQNIEAGSCLLVYTDEAGFTLKAVGWKGAKSLRAYIDLNDSIHLLRLLGADVSKFVVNKFQKKADEDNSAENITDENTTAKDGNVLINTNDDEDNNSQEDITDDLTN
ncbi:tRNA (cytosine(34)-C(5))-methyltransferase [Sitodiplosis mosellana]|uniref:tRNA (cytosine(34)-C(5))-methyltransferase n=1 Tax=Sitodiplosis mosellana TaxID=263140 RepID=UPI00244410F1|nr:tRNA (cytosine(34)-C(5))-methyltransferase [Sitodiplosis mosellana]